MRMLLSVAFVTAMLGAAAHAEVTDKSAAGFEVVEKATVAAPMAKAYAALLTPSAWWSSVHSFSGDAKNLSIDLASGCFCEKLPHGSVRHMSVVFADGTSSLRMFGGLGPMQTTGAAGHLGLTLKDAGDGKTLITATYDVGGYAKGGLVENWSAPIDRVLGEQVARLAKYLETGKPD